MNSEENIFASFGRRIASNGLKLASIGREVARNGLSKNRFLSTESGFFVENAPNFRPVFPLFSSLHLPAMSASVEDRIVAFAQSKIGQREKPGNAGFLDAAFERMMKGVGFDPGESWCCLFAELCWTEAFKTADPAKLPVIAKLFSESCLVTWKNFTSSKDFKYGLTPKTGAVAIFQHGTGWQGHAAIVSSYVDKQGLRDRFETIEGNTNAAGGREGIEVAAKVRKLSFYKVPNQLNLLGFIYPS